MTHTLKQVYLYPMVTCPSAVPLQADISNAWFVFNTFYHKGASFVSNKLVDKPGALSSIPSPLQHFQLLFIIIVLKHFLCTFIDKAFIKIQL